jgi:hypothetical protein
MLNGMSVSESGAYRKPIMRINSQMREEAANTVSLDMCISNNI